MTDELRKKIKKCFVDTEMEHGEDLLLFDTDKTISQIVKFIIAHDKTLKQKLLAGLPNAGGRLADEAGGYNDALSDVTKAIGEVYGE